MAATQEEVDMVLSAYEIAKKAPGYVDSIVCEMQQVSGDNYKMVWSTEYNGDLNRTNNGGAEHVENI